MEDVYNQVARYEGCKRRLASDGVLVSRGWQFKVLPQNRDLIIG